LIAILFAVQASGGTPPAPGTLGFYLLLFLSLPIALLIDAIIAGLFTNTPAKALIGIKATTSRGERLELGKHLRRNFGVWTDGLALGILPLSLIAMFRQFKRVSGRREAAYDERLHVRVRSGNMTALRVLIPLVLFTGAVFALLYLGTNNSQAVSLLQPVSVIASQG